MKENKNFQVGQIATDLINDYGISEQQYDQLLNVMNMFLDEGLSQWQLLAVIGDIFKAIGCDSEITPINKIFEEYFREYQKNCTA